MAFTKVFTFFIILYGHVCAAQVFTFQKVMEKQASKPNFVVLFADDIGWGDLGANWIPNENVTPNLNKIAENGLRLTNFHAGASVCTPSRASLLTGRIGLRTGVISNFEPDSVGGLPLNETTVAEVLHDHGYTTGMIGKWHLGMTHKFHPRSRGFDYYYGLPYSNDMGCVDVFTWNLPECKLCPKTPRAFQTNKEDPVKCRNYNSALPLYEDYEIVEQPADLVNLGDHYAEKAGSFIQQASKTGKPFLLYIAFAHMHAPQAHAKRFKNSTDVKTVYADTLHEMDDIVGRVIDTLKANGLYDNTLTWFTGDNGPWSGKCQYAGSQGPFLGSWLKYTYGGGTTAKCSTWEAGHREPTVVAWPGVIPPGTVSDALTSALDVFPTLLSAAGAPRPANRKYDGIDLVQFFRGETKTAHTELFHPNSFDTGIVGEIDTVRMGPYKVYWKTGGTWPDCGGALAPLVVHDPPIVFNVENDPAESILLTKAMTPGLEKIISDAVALRASFLDDVKADNTSSADYSHDPSALACCDPNVFYCRCKRDD